MYPADLETRFVTADGTSVCLRPIRPEDAAIEQAFVRSLSPQARFLRLQDTLSELSPHELKRLTEIDYTRSMAIIAVIGSGKDEREVGVARYAASDENKRVCEFAIVVADDWCGRGLAAALMHHLIGIARRNGFALMYGDILHHNTRMLKFVEKLGFRREPHPDDATLYRAILDLTPPVET